MFSQSKRIIIGCTVAIVLAGSFQAAFADTEANKAVIERWLEIWNTGDLTIADEIFAADFVNHDPSVPDVINLEGLKGLVVMSRIATPDLRITIEDMIAEGDKVVARLSAIGTHKGDFMGIPPTGVQVMNTRMITFRIDSGKIVETWENYDMLGVLQQLGVMPPSRETFTWGEPSTVTGDPGDPESNKAIVQRMIDEVMNNQNMAVIDELFAADYIMHDPAWPMEIKGPDGFKQWAGAMLEPFFSNSNITGEMTAEGDKVAMRMTFTGTHTGDLMGMAPTAKQVTQTEAYFFRFEGGNEVEALPFTDMLTFFQQLGISPPTG